MSNIPVPAIHHLIKDLLLKTQQVNQPLSKPNAGPFIDQIRDDKKREAFKRLFKKD